MNSSASDILQRARDALRDNPSHEWAADLVEVCDMLSDREKQLLALHKQLGAGVVTTPVRVRRERRLNAERAAEAARPCPC